MRVLLSAGEPSGDRWAAGIARALRRLAPDVEIRAMGSQALRDADVPLVVDSGPLAVVGLTEVLGSLVPLAAAMRRLRRTIEEWRPDVLVPVDYPDFNLRLSAFARSRGVEVAYFISPQVWAWRPGRLPAIGRAVSRMLVVFPFEVETYRRAGIPVTHVGHPLLDAADGLDGVAPSPTREQARSLLSLPQDVPVLALLPGSRRKEIRHVLPILVEAARAVLERHPALRCALPVAPGLDAGEVEAMTAGLPVTIVPGLARTVVAACDVAAVASGTATLETALAGRPLVVGYRVSPLTMALSRALADREFLARGTFALPNLVLGRRVVPELYQERFTAPAVAREILRLLEEPSARQEQLDQLAGLRGALGGPGSFERVARAVLELDRAR